MGVQPPPASSESPGLPKTQSVWLSSPKERMSATSSLMRMPSPSDSDALGSIKLASSDIDVFPLCRSFLLPSRAWRALQVRAYARRVPTHLCRADVGHGPFHLDGLHRDVLINIQSAAGHSVEDVEDLSIHIVDSGDRKSTR